MKIDDYSFGRIVIDGAEFTSDVIVYPDRLDVSWWRREGHLLVPADLTGVIAYAPDLLVIGTGHDGVMRVPRQTVEALREKGIEVFAAPTGEAVAEFNRLQPERPRIVAALHLTC
jgi:hypothetical protein